MAVKSLLSFLLFNLSVVSCFAIDKEHSTLKAELTQTVEECAVSAYFFQQGDIPLFLTSEHGAAKSQIIPSIAVRQGVGVRKFNPLFDKYTEEITRKVAQEFERISGKKPYMLIAKIHRSQIDFNRPPGLSYEHAKLKPCYDEFHRKARETVKEIKQRWGRGYLLDIHGQSKRPKHLVRGTHNGLTVSQLRKIEGDDIYQGEHGLFGILASKGYQVMPDFGQAETVYRGGYMVKTYGSHHKTGIDAVQFEIGRHYRFDKLRRALLIDDLALALVLRLNVVLGL